MHEVVIADSASAPSDAPLPGARIGTPPRRPGSIRRTATIDMVWPAGPDTALHLVGRARDLLTPFTGDPVVLDTAAMDVAIGADRTVDAITVDPHRAGIHTLVGAQGGTAFRDAIDAAAPGEREAATAMHLLLDDIAGCTLVAGFVLLRWRPDAVRRAHRAAPSLGMRKGKVICSGLRPDGFAQRARESGGGVQPATAPAGDVSTPDDPWGWHPWPERPEVCMRRHRRIDLWREGTELVVDELFRDSAWDPDGSELALHEYEVVARIDEQTGRLVSVAATPRVLPFPECPWAAPNAARLAGMPVRAFRTDVQQTLTELDCCTHLNDMLRCLAEVPVLSAHLPSESGRAGAVGGDG